MLVSLMLESTYLHFTSTFSPCQLTLSVDHNFSAYLYSDIPAKLLYYCLIAQWVKNPPAMQETPVRFLGQEDALEKG